LEQIKVNAKRIQVEVPDDNYWRKQIRCQEACPVHTDARGYVRAIAQGNFETAYLIARGPNPLASICGRVCAAPCEAACRRGQIDQPVSIRALKRFVTQQTGSESGRFKPLELLKRVLNAKGRECKGQEELASLRQLLDGIEAPHPQGPKIAIIGSGPAGLAAAHDLALLGYRPTVFEMEPIPAGMLAVGIPAYRLPRDLIQAEVEVIKSLGVEFRCNVEVGKDIEFIQLRADHAATIIAVGAKKSRWLDVPGTKGPGVLGGIEMLRDVALDEPVELGGKVIVVGGGNVAYDVSRSVIRQAGIDVSRTALRQEQVRQVNLVSLESLEELPADDLEIIEGDEEGVVRHHRWGPKQILRDENGQVTGMEFQRATRVFDDEGRFAPEFDESEILTLEADTVIWSIGQRADVSFVPKQGDVQFNERGLIQCDQTDFKTSAPDVFVAGDIAYGPRLLIDAVASGKKVARTIHEYLSGKKLQRQEVLMHLPILDYKREADYEKQARIEIPQLDPAHRVSSQSAVVETGYQPQMAICEAGRCLDCGVNTIFDSDKCILCGGCADVCPELCLRLVSLAQLEGGQALEQVIENRLEGDSIYDTSAIIKDETRCIRCALCEQRCPVGAITMERVAFDGTWEQVPAGVGAISV
jgi:formate dehydrogenase beta subunit